MYLDSGTIIAMTILLVVQLVMMIVLFRSAYKWEQRYRDTIRVLKIERMARGNHK
jgi:uncharacterized membrane protein